jgi:hypothetical protein
VTILLVPLQRAVLPASAVLNHRISFGKSRQMPVSMPIAGVPSQNSTQAIALTEPDGGWSMRLYSGTCLFFFSFPPSAAVQIKSYSIGGMYCQEICRRHCFSPAHHSPPVLP